MTHRRWDRRGYALVLVAAFSLLFVTFMGVAWRQLASTIGTFSARSDQMQQDQGTVMALADAMRALEVGPPPLTAYSAKPCYCCEVVPVIENLRIRCPADRTSYPDATQTCYYQLTFVKSSDSSGNPVYSVTATKLPEKPSDATNTLLNINDFGALGPI